MHTSADGTQELVERIGRLERQNRFWKIGGIAAMVALACSLTASVWAQALPPGTARALRAQTIEAQHFVLKSADGQTEREFTVSARGPVIELFGPGGKVIWSTRSGPRLEGD